MTDKHEWEFTPFWLMLLGYPAYRRKVADFIGSPWHWEYSI